MTHTPKYRGTNDELTAEKDMAADWLKAQIWAKLDDDMRQEIKDHGWPRIHHTIDHASSVGYYSTPYHKRTDLFHVWKIRDPAKRYGDKRFVIRKNGTVAIDTAVECIKGELRSQINLRREKGVLEENEKIWAEHFNFPARQAWQSDHLRAPIALSKTQHGMCTVRLTLADWDFKAKRTIRIEQVRPFLQWAAEVKDQLNGWD